MANFLWANDYQIINTDVITVINVDREGKSGTVQLSGYDKPVSLTGTAAEKYLQSFEGTRPKGK